MRRALLAAAALAGCTTPALAQEYGPAEAQKGAAFRVFATEAVQIVQPACPHSTEPETMAIMEPVIKRYERYKESLAGSSSSIDLTIAEADNEFLLSLADVNCAATDPPETRQKVESLTFSLALYLDNMEQMTAVR